MRTVATQHTSGARHVLCIEQVRLKRGLHRVRVVVDGVGVNTGVHASAVGPACGTLQRDVRVLRGKQTGVRDERVVGVEAHFHNILRAKGESVMT